MTPPAGRVLVPFAGSGSTGVACVAEGFGAVLVERDPHFAEVARRRVAEALRRTPAGTEEDGRPRPLSLLDGSLPPP